MPSQVATLKRTTVVISPKAAVAWADGYANEFKKHRGKEVEDGIEIGKNYFTTRPRGTLSAHGFGRRRTQELSRSSGLSENEAVLDFLREHCWKQKAKGRKVMGVRLILSMDPEKVSRLLHDLVDVDRLLVRVAEDTFEDLAEKFYPGDELGFVMGIHHDVRTHSQDRLKRLQGEDGSPPKKRLPHIHAHVFLLPQTKKGVRISLSNHTQPGRDGTYVDMLDEVLATYRENVQRQVYNLSIKPSPRLEPEWEPLVREACLSTMEDFFKAPTMTDLRSARRFGASKFAHHLSTMTREGLQRRHNFRRQQFLQLTRSNRIEIWNQIAKSFGQLRAFFRDNMEDRRKHLEELQANFKRPSDARAVHFWDVPSGKSLLLKPTEGRLVAPKNRSGLIRQSLLELDDIRKASMLQDVGAITLMEMKLGAILPQIEDPQWIDGLAKIAQMKCLPHQEILDAAAQAGPRMPAEAVVPAALAAPATPPAERPQVPCAGHDPALSAMNS